ncbi:MFS general substrate transporter [Polychaeton citri CBS 116435]|uniref:MFS general substrate transporter n=1 Tax=Polychaeton citri CBS 116435 TaxID=1314669 RepID=A0A9P4Q132_9PEZI|nr:MFS general substrate transporter [Polychaeton citri CBS 116435]
MLAAYVGCTVVSSPCLLGAAVLLFVGKTIVILVLARILQGMSCAFVWTIGLAICVETVEPDRTIQIFCVIAIGTLWAPFVGGALYEKAGMQGVMTVAISVLAIDLVLRLLSCADREASDEEQPLLDSERGGNKDLKLSQERPRIKKAVPIVPCLSNPSLLTALFGSLMHAILMGSFDVTLATVSHKLFEFDSFQAGMLFLLIGIMHLVCGPTIGWAVDRYGTKVVAVFAFSILVPALVLLRFVGAGGAFRVTLYAALLSFAGIGLAGAGTPSIVEIGIVIDKYHSAYPKSFGDKGPYAMMYGMNGIVFNAGLTIGSELAGKLTQTIGYGNMNTVLAIISGMTAWLCLLYLGSKPRTELCNKDEPGQPHEPTKN